MSSHGTREPAPESVRLPPVVPFSVAGLRRLCWERGSAVVSDATLLGAWEHVTGRTLACYDSAEDSVVVAVTTPVGRERFYDAAECDLDRDRWFSRLDGAEDWRRREDGPERAEKNGNYRAYNF